MFATICQSRLEIQARSAISRPPYVLLRGPGVLFMWIYAFYGFYFGVWVFWLVRWGWSARRWGCALIFGVSLNANTMRLVDLFSEFPPPFVDGDPSESILSVKRPTFDIPRRHRSFDGQVWGD